LRDWKMGLGWSMVVERRMMGNLRRRSEEMGMGMKMGMKMGEGMGMEMGCRMNGWGDRG